jgi:hypothetical protein
MLVEHLDNWCHASCITVCHAMSTNSETMLSENDWCWPWKGIEMIFQTGGFIFVMERNALVSTIWCKRSGSVMKATQRPMLYTPNLPSMVAVVAGCCGSHMMKLWALICRMQNIANSWQQLIDEIQYVLILCYRTADRRCTWRNDTRIYFRTFTLWIWIHSCHYIWFCSD